MIATLGELLDPLIVLIVLNTVIFLLLIVSLYFNYKHAVFILSVQDAIEESLDELDKRYTSIGKILTKPIFFDSIEVRQVMSDIGRCRNSVLKVAKNMTVIEEEKEQNG